MTFDRVGEPGQVLQNVKSSLLWKAKCRSALDARRTHDALNVAKPGTMGRRELVVEQTRIVFTAEKEEAVQASEVAVDLLLAHDLLDPVYSGRMARCRDAGAIGAMRFFDSDVPVVERVGEVRRRAPRFATPDLREIHDHDSSSRARERVRDGEARDARSDDADIRCEMLRERPADWSNDGGVPDGLRGSGHDRYG